MTYVVFINNIVFLLSLISIHVNCTVPPMSLHKVTEELSKKYDAACLDGTPQAFYHRQALNKTS